jgi:Cof subfamily protein (haloacid dehalogenase superfamily)
MRYRLLALDIDGTLLDPAGELSAGAREAVAGALRAGLRVVLCTGRRFRSTRPIAQALGLEGPVVVHNGALVKDLAGGRTLRASYLAAELQPEILAALRPHGPPLLYVDGWPQEDILTEPRGPFHPHQVEYLEQHAEHCRFVATLAAESREDVVMMSWMADAPKLGELEARLREALGDRVRTHRLGNHGFLGSHILEVLAPGTGKWTALRGLAEAEGISAHEIAAVGDDRNDLDLIAGAALGIAMGNAPEDVRAAADRVVAGNDREGVVEAIEAVLRAR